MEHRRAQLRLAIQVVGFRRIYLLNASIIFFFFVKPSADDSVLLNVDAHYSNTKNTDVVDKAWEHIVAIVSLPPPSKHKMQPLDVGFMESRKHIMHKKLKRG
jgi:hypothetical protein